MPRIRLKKVDLILIGSVLAAAVLLACFLLFRPTKPVSALIYQDNQLIKTIPLASAPDQAITVEGDYPLTVVIHNGSIGIREATCPDKLCEHYGMLHKTGQTAVCLPNRTAIRLEGQAQDEIIRVQP